MHAVCLDGTKPTESDLEQQESVPVVPYQHIWNGVRVKSRPSRGQVGAVMLRSVAIVERPFDRGSRRGQHWLDVLGEEFRTARLSNGLSQAAVANAARISRSVYSRVERGARSEVQFLALARIASVLGLDLFVRAYPAGPTIRDRAQAALLNELLANVRPPLRHRVDVPLPRNDERPEYRAWDAVISGPRERTTVELETRLYDLQAQVRRFRLKLRDDPPAHFLLVVADTRSNRRILADFPELLADFPRQKRASVLATLRKGEHPTLPTGLVLL
jgi:transcriptional regulator with XRE-family HTH domain